MSFAKKLGWSPLSDPETQRARQIRRELAKSLPHGHAAWWPLFFAATLAVGFGVGISWPRQPVYVYYGLRVQKLIGPDSMAMISPATGPFRADFCPDSKIAQYEPKAGYVMCKLSYVDRGCMDVSRKDAVIIWVKDKYGSTATLAESDTFQGYPKCVKDEFTASR